MINCAIYDNLFLNLGTETDRKLIFLRFVIEIN